MTNVYITAPPKAAADLARSLVDERVAACVNVLDCRSVYRFEGEVHDEDEAVLVAKTSEDRYEDLLEYVTAIHPYEVPCIERFDETEALPAFADWRDDAVS